MDLFNLENGLYCVQSGVFFSNKNLDTIYSFLYLVSLIMCKRVGEIIARTLCFMQQSTFRLNYIFHNDAYFLDFCAENYSLIFF